MADGQWPKVAMLSQAVYGARHFAQVMVGEDGTTVISEGDGGPEVCLCREEAITLALFLTERLGISSD